VVYGARPSVATSLISRVPFPESSDLTSIELGSSVRWTRRIWIDMVGVNLVETVQYCQISREKTF